MNKYLKNQKGVAFIPLIIWVIVVSGSVFIAQDAVKQGYITIDSPYISKEIPTPQPTAFPTPLPTYKPSSEPTFKPPQGQVKGATQTNQNPTSKHDGSRTGRIIDYNSLCEGKTIKVYENELIPYKRITGETIYTTKGDIRCYEDQLAQLKQQHLGSDNNVQSQPVSKSKEAYNPVTCVLSYGTYQLSLSSCDEAKRKDPQYIKCELRNGTYSMTQEQCIKEQQSDIDNFIGEVYQQYSQEEQRKTNLSNCLTKASEEKDRMLQWESTQNNTTDLVRQQIYRNWGQAENGCHTLYGY